MLADIIAKVVPIGGLRSPGSSFFWLYLAAAAIFALAVCAHRARGPGALQRAAREVFDPRVFFHRSAVVDYKLVYINSLMSVAGLGLGIASVEAIAQWGAGGLTRVFGPSPALPASLLAGVAITLSMALAFDFANFYFHWLQHRIPFLWELHKVHHSAEVLTPLTALRVHPLAAILGSQFIAICLGVPGAVFAYLYDGPAAEVTILGVNAVIFFWHTLLANHLAHTQVWVMFPRGIREIFYSPALHLIHHSADPRHAGKNLGFCFAFWDRLAGTLYQPQDGERQDLVLGIDPESMSELQTTWQLYWTPIRNILVRRKPDTRPVLAADRTAGPILD